MEDILFATKSEVLRIVLAGVMVYACLVLLLRISGKRTLSKWNSFDFVVTVAFGSTFATALLSKDVSVAEAVMAFVMLVVLQFVVTWLSVRSAWFRKMVKSKPSIIFMHGRFIEERMKNKRVTRSEVKAAIRSRGHGSVAEIDAVVLETDGSFSIISSHETLPEKSSLEGVEGFTEYINSCPAKAV
ncbi:DUF421 domain-containing protein [Fulvivirga kasyanovii]|uniref:DUF421 domain-containing protein n=1 Tax=Fulvivirga kasyanovii TaxID=396812 RepID=A0ABW9RKZ3_9BACT|nr:YetF domain-containing protein [Fulvivirga kasyanovii]MTI23870.1 DUF421 domain-containing protein [Fulvivirga kasyanovii]